MLGRKVFTAVLATAAIAAIPAFAQESSDELSKNEVSIQFMGSAGPQMTKDGETYKASNSQGGLVTVRRLFTKHYGVEGDFSYTRDSQYFNGTRINAAVKSNTWETTGAFVYRIPLKQWTPFVLGGGGAAVFAPKDGGDKYARAAIVFGAGADYNLGRYTYIRAEFRGQVYKSPSMNITGLGSDVPWAIRLLPSIGVGCRW